MTPTPHPNRRFGFLWLWVLVPLCYTLFLAWKWTPDFPHADHWGLESDLFLADSHGGLTWDLLADQKNDSRYVLSRLCYWWIGKATAWNLRVEAAICVLMGGGIAILAWWMARRTIPGRAADWTGALMSLLILSPHQAMNWNFGVQICYFLPIGAAVGISALHLTRLSLARQTAAGILLAMVATWSFAPGWLAWGLVIWGILGWLGRLRPAAVVLALIAVCAALGANAAFYFKNYIFQEGIPLTQKLAERGTEIAHYFLKMLGAPLAEGWLQPNQAARGAVLDRLSPTLSILLLVWIVFILNLHRRDLLRRRGASPAWAWIGIGGWSLLAVGMVSLARTGNVLSHPFASRYLAFTLWAWLAAFVLTLMLPPGKTRRILVPAGALLLLWGWAAGAATGVKQMHKDWNGMRLLQGALTLSAVAPEPQGLRGNDPAMHNWLPIVSRLDELGYLRPRLVRSPLVADAQVSSNPAIQGQIREIITSPTLSIHGHAIDPRRGGVADSIILSYQEEGGQEIWWTPVTARTMDKTSKKIAAAEGLEGEHARIGWIWEAGIDATHYQIVPLPARPCIIRAYVLDAETGKFHPLEGAIGYQPAP
ncbi:MAG: hypothetical protein JWL81_1599 [Verrucomicrobiales bacterium]|nr:hypothetical protein [Verrucomicrobiales bacterium]